MRSKHARKRHCQWQLMGGGTCHWVARGRVGFYGHPFRPGPSHLTCNGRARRRSAWRSLADIVRAASFHRSRKTSPWTRWRIAHGTQQYLGGAEYLQRGTNIARRTHSAGQWCRNGAADRAGSDARAPRRKRRGGTWRKRAAKHAYGAQPTAATAEAVAASVTVQRGSDARAPRWQRGDGCAVVPATGTVTMTSLPPAVRPAGFFEASTDLTSRTYRSGAPAQGIPTCQVGFTSCVGPVASVGLVKSENFMCVRPSSPKPTCRSENISSIRPVVQPSDPAGRFLTCQVGF